MTPDCKELNNHPHLELDFTTWTTSSCEVTSSDPLALAQVLYVYELQEAEG